MATKRTAAWHYNNSAYNPGTGEQTSILLVMQRSSWNFLKQYSVAANAASASDPVERYFNVDAHATRANAPFNSCSNTPPYPSGVAHTSSTDGLHGFRIFSPAWATKVSNNFYTTTSSLVVHRIGPSRLNKCEIGDANYAKLGTNTRKHESNP